MKHPLVAHGPLGLEEIAAHEMRGLGFDVREVHADEGVVEWEGTLEDVATANLAMRTVDRITLEVGRFQAFHFGQLERKTRAIDWRRWIGPERKLLVRVSSRASKLYHERAIAERVARSIEAALGRTIELVGGEALDDDATNAQLVVVRALHDEFVIRLDSSGTRLHRRGYRLATAKAPLRETLAASVLLASGWSPGQALVDPFCGSGTFAIEAAAFAAGHVAGAKRSFAFERWATAVPRPEIEFGEADPAPILASDREEGAIRAATDNATRAGVLDRIDFRRQTMSDARPPAQASAGFVVTNPPYQLRTDKGEDPERLYAAFGRRLREEFAGWHCTMLCARQEFARATGLDWEFGPWINNGGVRVRLIHLAPEPSTVSKADR